MAIKDPLKYGTDTSTVAPIDAAALGRYFGGVSATPAAANAPAVVTPVTPTAAEISAKAVADKAAADKAAAEKIAADKAASDAAAAAIKAADTLSARQNVFDQVSSLFESYGVLKKDPITGKYNATSQALYNTIKSLAMSGAGADTVSLGLQQSQAYKDRFAGNEARKAAGLNVLSPAEYIATENAYDQVLRAAGVPAQFYNDPSEKATLIGADVSPSELSTRVDLAKKSIQNADPFYTQQLQNYYGLSQGDMIAHVLDPKAAVPLIEKQVSSATVGAEAARQGLAIAGTTAEQLAAIGVTQAQAQQGFTNIAMTQPEEQRLASIYNQDAGAQGAKLTAATFGTAGGAQAQLDINRLKQQEVSTFSGSAGAAKGSLGTDQSGVL
jgi:hypothetical protein